MSYVGRIEDTFILTRNNDVITFTPSSPAGERVQRYETHLQSLDVATLWSDGAVIAGDGDEVLHFDLEDGLELMISDGALGPDTHIDLVGVVSYNGEVCLALDNGFYSSLITEGWGAYWGV